jgi:hypothetical protein
LGVRQISARFCSIDELVTWRERRRPRLSNLPATANLGCGWPVIGAWLWSTKAGRVCDLEPNSSRAPNDVGPDGEHLLGRDCRRREIPPSPSTSPSWLMAQRPSASTRSPQHRVNREHPNQNSERLVLVSYSGEHALLDRYRYRPRVSVASSLALSIWAALIPAACWRWQSCDDPYDAPCPGLMQSMRTRQPNWPWSRRE